MKVERSFSRHSPRGTHAPQSIIYGTPRGEHLKGDFSVEVEIKGNEKAMAI